VGKAACTAFADQAATLEHAQVLRDGRLRYIEVRLQLADGVFPQAKAFEDGQPGTVAKRPHELRLHVSIYKLLLIRCQETMELQQTGVSVFVFSPYMRRTQNFSDHSMDEPTF
jgi:hypothetical protein